MTDRTNNTRDIIQIDEDLCNGCGQCITGCAEGALALVDGKAKLVSDIYCDGLGNCLGHCPTGALTIIQREAPDFDEEAAMERVEAMKKPASGGCPGSRARALKPLPTAGQPAPEAQKASGLASWPIQLKLVPPAAEFLDTPVLTLASDCSAFAGPAFHQTFLSEGYPLIIACPKLDEVEPYIEKMAAILKGHPQIKELRIPMMSVPCCGGLGYIATQALKKSGRESDVSVRTWIITPQGEITEESIR
ncbi:4Fe-4S ferredoxin [Deltaproteobacteria bacterium Smac51]|nr:4Fe-4S ferredoxin [Deltaproteobacteria bacterium Smac51]